MRMMPNNLNLNSDNSVNEHIGADLTHVDEINDSQTNNVATLQRSVTGGGTVKYANLGAGGGGFDQLVMTRLE
mgnify:CR=1